MSASDSVVFDRAAEYYDSTRGFPPGEETSVADLFVRAGGLSETSRVLEIGVGTGRIALPLAARLGALVGIDLSRPMMLKLRGKQQAEPVWLAEGDALRLPLRDHAFDAAVAVHVFHLIPGWREALNELARILKHGAPLLLGWNDRRGEDPLDAIWREASGLNRETSGAVSWSKRETFLLDAGWGEATGRAVHMFKAQRSPQEFVEGIRNRRWSHCWKMTDEQLVTGLSAVQRYIEQTYSDPSLPVDMQALFVVRGYTAPG
jgi:SAM-dependent methyltransferase